MKTILVVFNASSVDEANSNKLQKYAFNTKEEVKVGDVLTSNSYTGSMLVTDVLETSYKYYNNKTSQLTDTINSTCCYPIKELILGTENTNMVYFTFDL